jgi:serine protease Do
VKVVRDGATKNLQVTVNEVPGAESLAKNEAQKSDDSGTLNGVTVGDLDNRVRQEFGVPSGLQGVAVTEVEPDSAAAEAGLRPGDVIVEINRKPVKSADEAVRLTEKTDSKKSLLRVWRNGGSRYVVVDESKQG